MPRTAKDVDGIPLVSVLELAARLGTTSEAVRARLNGEIVRNWAGEPSVAAAVARAVVEEVERERAEQEEAEAERQAAERAWASEREAVYRNAFEQALEAEARRALEELARENVVVLGAAPPIGPDARARAAEVAREAVAEWERKNPKP
jgi:hypothetical protein